MSVSLSKEAYAAIEGEWKNFRFRRIEPADHKNVFGHISNSFVRDEPTCKLFGYTDDFAADINRLVSVMLRDNMSFLAEDINTGEIAGVRITFHHTKESSLEMEFVSPSCITLVKLLEDLETMGNVPKNLGVDSWAEFFAASTSPKYRQQGLAGEFYRRSIEFLKKCGFIHVVVIVSSPFTRMATKRQGFQELSCIRFKDFLGSDGKPVFQAEKLNDEHFACFRYKIL